MIRQPQALLGWQLERFGLNSVERGRDKKLLVFAAVMLAPCVHDGCVDRKCPGGGHSDCEPEAYAARLLLPPRPLGEGWGEGSPQGAQSAKQAECCRKNPFSCIKSACSALFTDVSSYLFDSNHC